MHPFLVQHLVLPVHEKLMRRDTFRRCRELDRSQWFSAPQLEAIQLAKLRRLVAVALNQTEYYAAYSHLERDWQPDSLGDLERLPLIDKDVLSTHREQLVNRAVKGGAIPYRTGGSSGKPLIFYFDKRRQAYDKAARIRTHLWWGIAPGDREAYIWNSPVELSKQDKAKRLRDWLTNEKIFPASELSPNSIGRFVEGLGRFRPKCLFGYPSAMTLMCQLARREGLSLGDLPVKVVFSTAEVLHDHQRRTISEALGGVPVANGYGSREAGFISHQCPEGTMHITSENVIVEIVRDGRRAGPDEDGEIVVTQLDSLATPFIRYRTADIGRLTSEPCPCGRGLAGMSVVKGRSNDFLITGDGRHIHSSAVHAALSGIAGIVTFQLRQGADRHVRVLLVTDAQFPPDGERRLVGNLQQRLGDGESLSVDYVDEIAPSASGKHRYIISELSALA